MSSSALNWFRSVTTFPLVMSCASTAAIMLADRRSDFLRALIMLFVAGLLSPKTVAATRYYYSAENVTAIGVAYVESPAPANFLEEFEDGQFSVILDDDAGGFGLLTVEGTMQSAGIDPKCSLPGAQCPEYLGDPIHLYLEKQFSLENQFSFDPSTGAFTVDLGPVQNSFIEYVQPNGAITHYPLENGSEPLHSDQPLSLVGAFNFFPDWPGVTIEELIIQMDLEFNGTTPENAIPEPATAALIASGCTWALLQRRQRKRW